jgi:hypothetical protein
MTLEYSLTLADIKAAFKLHRRRNFYRRFSTVIWPLVTITCLSIAFASNTQSGLFAAAISVGVGALWMSLTLPILRMYQVRRCFKQLFPKARTNPLTATEVNEEFVLCRIPGVGETKYLWKAMFGFAQDERSTLFYLRKNAFMFLPTAALSQVQRLELNDLVTRHIGNR